MDLVKERQSCNKQILHLLQYLVEKYPSIRFGQLLMDTVYTDLEDNKIWNEESRDVLKRLEDFIK